MRIYIDILVLENYIVSLFLLKVTARLIRVKGKYLHLNIAALLLALYTLCTFFPSLRIFTALPFKLILPLLGVYISFRVKDIVFNIKATAVYLSLSFLLAGICFFIETSSMGVMHFYVIKEVSYRVILTAIMIILMVSERIFSALRERNLIKSYIFMVEIKHLGREAVFYALLDTGNELREPATNLPVIIVESEILRDMELPIEKSYYIPYKLVNGNAGLLKGFIPEALSIYKDDEKNTIEAIVCCTEEKLSRENDFQGLLSRGILQGCLNETYKSNIK